MRKLSWFFVFAFMAYACQLQDATDEVINPLRTGAIDNTLLPSNPTSAGGIIPYILVDESLNPGGNRTCDDLFNILGLSYDNTIGKFDYPFESPLIVDVDGYHIEIVITEGTFVSWTSNVPIKAAFIVKGSNDANIYFYDDCGFSSDSGLASPEAGQSGGAAGLSNLTVCWSPCEEPPKCYDDETAWAAGSRYIAKGNWATYTPYAGVQKTVTLYAGQTINVGTVTFSAPVDNKVTMTINLTGGWEFYNVAENIKVQDYADAPNGNPSPGLFAWKTTATGIVGSLEVPVNNFYGVHVDVGYPVPCE